MTDADVAGPALLPVHPRADHDRRRAELHRWRAPATPASSATRSTAQPEHAERLWQALLDQGASLGIRPYGLAAVESLRIEAGLIFIGFDYFPGATSPFHMNLDRTINLETGDFVGKAALQAELAAGITHRMTTLVIAGEEAPDYGAEVFRHGRMVGKLTSPSAGRSPTVDRLIAMACIEADLVEPGTRVEVVAARRPDGRRRPPTTTRSTTRRRSGRGRSER